MQALGKHVILELNDCDRGCISNCEFLRRTLLEACRLVGATILGDSFHVFSPYDGVSGVIIIAESHLSIHTWPEYGYAAVDIFACGDSLQPQSAVDFMVRELKADNHSILELERGILNSPVLHE
ncbi:MAG: adenosylmethionine decarboxylase [Chloroflexota bacterium]|nr:adenosylmethionine decarboxylase [Chloroflexota bacterium]